MHASDHMSWSSSLRLPKSTFPPRPTASETAKYLQRCTGDLYIWQRRERPVEWPFILHDGPPYANGGLHVGHALNKILKDIICRTQLAQGKRVSYVPGWDCHGLPIELKALEKHGWKEGGTSTDALAIRQAARTFASKTIEDQMQGFKSWGIMGDWDNHWKTMDKDFELRQLAVFKAMTKKDLIYRKHKPVYWSPSSLTALAEAELEYRDDHLSTAALVKFPLNKRTSYKAFEDIMPTLFALIWTTTPWTIPANQAIAVHRELEYLVGKSEKHGHLLLASSRLPFVEELLGEELKVVTSNIAGESLLTSTYQKPEIFDVGDGHHSVVHADFVSADAGTGLVHCAPAHGMEDYDALQSLIDRGAVTVSAPVDDAGYFSAAAAPKQPDALLGLDVFGAGNKKVLELLDTSKLLLAKHSYKHRYPYDWRTKKPVMIRATAQWFADVSSLRDSALVSIEKLWRPVPESGRARLASFVKNRSEWCISRQRAWGVPIPALYHKSTGQAVLTDASISHVVKVIGDRGIDAWWSDKVDEPAWVVPELLNADGSSDYRRGSDTMDVWFDSGTSWTHMIESGQPNHVPVADVYIEGTDQHRGWFQSSLLTHNAFQVSLETNKHPVAPFRTLITHGFTLDGDGKKMSKSVGNVVSPDQIMAGTLLQSPVGQLAQKSKKTSKTTLPLGPDVLRLWVASSDFTRDVIVSETVIKSVHQSLHKYRVTFKLLLGNLTDYQGNLSYECMSLVDRIALHHLWNASKFVRQAMDMYEFHKAINAINRYLAEDFSSFYIEAVKDILYCDKPKSSSIIGDDPGNRRAAVQTVLMQMLVELQSMLAPICPLLVEESWEHIPESLKPGLGHPHQRLRTSGPLLEIWHNDFVENEQLPVIASINRAVKSAQEQARSEKKMGSSLDCNVLLVLEESLQFKIEEEKDPVKERIYSQGETIRESLAQILVVSDVQTRYQDGTESWQSILDFSPAWQSEAAVRNEKGETIGLAVVYEPRDKKCARCWRYLVPDEIQDRQETVQAHILETRKHELDDLCDRCVGVVEGLNPRDKADEP